MSRPLYTTELLRLAASLSEPHLLEREDGSSDVRSPTCGSRIHVAVQLDRERRVDSLSMRVHACAFGQASAALVERNGRGKSQEDLAAAVLTLSRWLAGESEDVMDWPGLELLEPARPYNARHGAILLPFRALLAAIEAAQ